MDTEKERKWAKRRERVCRPVVRLVQLGRTLVSCRALVSSFFLMLVSMNAIYIGIGQLQQIIRS